MRWRRRVAASGNPVVFSVDASSGAGVCVLDASGTMVSFTGAGRCVIDANQAGDADYDAAAQQQQSFTGREGVAGDYVHVESA